MFRRPTNRHNARQYPLHLGDTRHAYTDQRCEKTYGVAAVERVLTLIFRFTHLLQAPAALRLRYSNLSASVILLRRTGSDGNLSTPFICSKDKVSDSLNVEVLEWWNAAMSGKSLTSDGFAAPGAS